MRHRAIAIFPLAALCVFTAFPTLRAQDQPVEVKTHWDQVVRVSKPNPPSWWARAPAFGGVPRRTTPSSRALRIWVLTMCASAAGDMFCRTMEWPKLAPPTATATSWDFTYADPMIEDIMNAVKGHPIVLNFTSIPEVDVQANGIHPLPHRSRQILLGLLKRQGLARSHLSRSRGLFWSSGELVCEGRLHR